MKFFLPDIVCEVCTTSINTALAEYIEKFPSSNIKRFYINAITHTLIVDIEGNDSKEQIYAELKSILKGVGQTCIMDADEITNDSSSSAKPSVSWFAWFNQKTRSHAVLGTLGVIAGLLLLLLPLFISSLPFIAMICIGIVSTLITAFIGAEFYRKAMKQIEIREPAMDTLFALSTLIVISVSIAAFFVPGLSMMFETGLLIFGFRHLGLAIRDSVYQSMGVRARFQDTVPSHVLKYIDGEYISTPINELKPNDEILILPNNQMLPIDGCYIDEPDDTRFVSIINIKGDTKPKRIMPGDRLLAGMILQPNQKPMRMKVDMSGYALKWASQPPTDAKIKSQEIIIYREAGQLYFAAKKETKNTENNVERICLPFDIEDDLLKTLSLDVQQKIYTFAASKGFDKPVRNSYLERVDRSIDVVEAQKGPLKIMTEQVLRYIVPSVFVIALLVGAILACFFPWTIALVCAVGVLVSICPCSMGLITPLAITIGKQKAVDIIFNQSIEGAAAIDCVVFDYHGTFTQEKFQASDPIVLDSDLTKAKCDAYWALLEERAKHLFGHVIYEKVGGAKALKTAAAAELKLSSLDQTHHSGLTGIINGDKYIIGNIKMLEDHIDSSTLKQLIKKPEPGQIYLVRETFDAIKPKHTILSSIVIEAPIRSDAEQMLDLLRAKGIEVKMCTGADKITALAATKKLKIPVESVRFTQTAAMKADYIKELKAQGYRVLMVGDAINDSVAMAASDFSIAMNHQGGNKVTVQLASAVIETGKLIPIVTAIEISKQTVANIKQTLIFSLIYNVIAILLTTFLLLATGIVLNPGICAAIMIVQTCLILLNLFRFQQQPLPHLVNPQTYLLENNSYAVMGNTLKNVPSLSHDVTNVQYLEETITSPPRNKYFPKQNVDSDLNVVHGCRFS